MRASSPWSASSAKISLYFPAKQGLGGGDRFADDCLHRQFFQFYQIGLEVIALIAFFLYFGLWLEFLDELGIQPAPWNAG
jgi:hypothetical protein